MYMVPDGVKVQEDLRFLGVWIINDIVPLHARFPGILCCLQLHLIMHRHVCDDLASRWATQANIQQLREQK